MINFLDGESIDKTIELEKISLMSTLDIQKNLNKQILIFMKNLMANIKFSFDVSPDAQTFLYLNESTNYLNQSNSNINVLKGLIDSLSQINVSSENLEEQLENYNNNFKANINCIYNTSEAIEKFVHKITMTDFSKSPDTSTDNFVEMSSNNQTNNSAEIPFSGETNNPVETPSTIPTNNFAEVPSDIAINTVQDNNCANNNCQDANNYSAPSYSENNVVNNNCQDNNYSAPNYSENNVVNNNCQDNNYSDSNCSTYNSVDNNSSEANFVENTLIISETQKKVILPYNLQQVNAILQGNNAECHSAQDVIDKFYTKPISNYKFSPIARFKEAYKLVIEKEKGSKLKALGLALELFGNYNLHPAIITSCNSLDELDIYLACLEEDSLEDFHFFNIKYEIPLAISKLRKPIHKQLAIK